MFWLDTINEMKKEKGMTTEEISNLSGIAKGTLNKLFAGQTKDPQLSTIKAVVHCMGYTLDDLDEKNSQPSPNNTADNLTDIEHGLIKKYRSLSIGGRKAADNMIDFVFDLEQNQKRENNIIDINIRRLPLYDVPVSAGTGNFLDDSPFDIMEVGPDAPIQTSYLLRASGDSMEPKIFDGETLYIKQQDFVEDGEIGIFWYDGQVYVKKLERRGNSAYLISLNPKYQPIKINGDPIRCYGKVLNK